MSVKNTVFYLDLKTLKEKPDSKLKAFAKSEELEVEDIVKIIFAEAKRINEEDKVKVTFKMIDGDEDSFRVIVEKAEVRYKGTIIYPYDKIKSNDFEFSLDAVCGSITLVNKKDECNKISLTIDGAALDIFSMSYKDAKKFLKEISDRKYKKGYIEYPDSTCFKCFGIKLNAQKAENGDVLTDSKVASITVYNEEEFNKQFYFETEKEKYDVNIPLPDKYNYEKKSKKKSLIVENVQENENIEENNDVAPVEDVKIELPQDELKAQQEKADAEAKRREEEDKKRQEKLAKEQEELENIRKRQDEELEKVKEKFRRELEEDIGKNIKEYDENRKNKQNKQNEELEEKSLDEELNNIKESFKDIMGEIDSEENDESKVSNQEKEVEEDFEVKDLDEVLGKKSPKQEKQTKKVKEIKENKIEKDVSKNEKNNELDEIQELEKMFEEGKKQQEILENRIAKKLQELKAQNRKNDLEESKKEKVTKNEEKNIVEESVKIENKTEENVKSYTLDSYKGLRDDSTDTLIVYFGQSKKDIRKILGKPKQIKDFEEMEMYDNFYVYYDENDKCVGIGLYNNEKYETSLKLNIFGRNLIDMKYRHIVKLIKRNDPNSIEDDDGIISLKYGISVDPREEKDSYDDICDVIHIFQKGYYDEVYENF